MTREARPPAERSYGMLTRSERNNIERGLDRGDSCRAIARSPGRPVHGRQRGGAPQVRDVAQVNKGPAGAGGPGRVCFVKKI